MVENFNKANAGKIKATTLAVPYDAFADKITAAVPRGKGPDVFIFAQDRLGGWIAAGNTVEPLDFFLDDKIKGRLLEGHPGRHDLPGEHLRPAAQLQGHHHDLQQEAGDRRRRRPRRSWWRWPRSSPTSGGGKFGLAYCYSDFYYHAALMNGFGGGVFGPNRKPTLNSPQNVKSLDLLIKLDEARASCPASRRRP